MSDLFKDFKDELPSYVKNEEDFQLYKMRHSAEHVLTQAMFNIYGKDKVVMAMGPATEEGFYFDFENKGFELTPDSFKEIEKEMRKIINKGLPIVRKEVSLEEAKEIFKDNKYKMEWLDLIDNKHEKISIYVTGDDEFIDLCKGPHVDNTKEIKAFKLLRIAGAYWHGDEKNIMLTRIYGTAFNTEEELKTYLNNQKELEKRNHRKLGKQLGLFALIPEVGQGLPIWLHRGYTIRRILENYMYKLEEDHGYTHILTPHIYNEELFKISGHLNFYKESMYSVIKIDDERYYLKPMNCPASMMVYKMENKSYRDLPLKMGEFGTVYRYEKSGELQGLQRVRGFTQNDAHIFCTADQLKDSINEVLDLLEIFYKDVGFSKYRYRLSLSDRVANPKKYAGDVKRWAQAEETLREVLISRGVEFEEMPGDAAFYGPKIDVQAVNVFGKEDSISTVQLDFNLSARFNIRYIDENGVEQEPYVIHRALMGSFERFFAFLIESCGGDFPLWLAPEHACIIPISDKHHEYAKKLYEEFKKHDFRIKLDDRGKSMQSRIRDAEKLKIPYILVLGDKELESNTVSVRDRRAKTETVMSIDEFVKKIKKEVEDKVI